MKFHFTNLDSSINEKTDNIDRIVELMRQPKNWQPSYKSEVFVEAPSLPHTVKLRWYGEDDSQMWLRAGIEVEYNGEKTWLYADELWILPDALTTPILQKYLQDAVKSFPRLEKELYEPSM